MLTDIDLKLLARVVDRYDDSTGPVTAAGLADVVDGEESDIRECLAGLAANELLAPVEGGYRPTVTGRELLELDIDLENELVVFEFDSEHQGQSETGKRHKHGDGDGSPGER